MSVLRHNQEDDDSTLNWIGKGEPTNAAYIRQCIALANDMQVRIYVNFIPPQAELRTSLFSVCIGMDEQSFCLYLLGEVPNLPPVGKEVEVFFILRHGKKGVPCLFPTKVLRLSGSREGHNLILAYPKYISHNQRRYTIRVPVSNERIPGFAVWHGVMEGSVAPSGGPMLSWNPLNLDNVKLVDLSAGGMRLHVLPSCPCYDVLLPKEMLLVHGDFALPSRKPLPICLQAGILRIIKTPDGNGKMLAIRFQKELHSAPDTHWTMINEQDGVAAIRPWIFNLLAEVSRHRQNPIQPLQEE